MGTQFLVKFLHIYCVGLDVFPCISNILHEGYLLTKLDPGVAFYMGLGLNSMMPNGRITDGRINNLLALRLFAVGFFTMGP